MEKKITEFFLKGIRPQIIIAVIVLIIIVSTYYFINSQSQEQQKASIINLQNKCAIQAKNLVDNIQSTNSNMIYTYTNHYSFYLNKCYALIHGVGIAGTGISDKLVDVYGNTDIADCESYATAPQLNSCVFNGLASAYNVNNFNDFTKGYMENN